MAPPKHDIHSRLGLGGSHIAPLKTRNIDTRHLPDLSALKDQLIDRSLKHFIQATWSLVEPGAKYIHGWHIDAISEHLQAVSDGKIKRLIINIPPRHSKSLQVAVFWPAWVWSWRPETKWIFGSHDQRLSVRDSTKMRRLIESPWYKERYPNVRLEKDQNAKGYYLNTATGHRMATSVGAGITGEGGDILVFDDPHNALDAITSATSRQSAIDWWTTTMSSRLNPGSPMGAKVGIMQRLHERDLTGYLLARRDEMMELLAQFKREGKDLTTERYIEENADPDATEENNNALAQQLDAIDPEDFNYEHLVLPAFYESRPTFISKTILNFVDPRTKEGEALWEAGMPKKRLQVLALELGSYAAAGQLQQRPSPVGGGQINGRWFQRLKRDMWPSMFDEVIQAWDLSCADDPESDYTVGFLLGRIGSNIYLIKRIRGKMAFTQQLKSVKAMSDLHPEAAAKIVEKAANATALHNTLTQEIPGIILVPATDNKVRRALAWTPYAEAGNIYVPDDAIWLDEFINECEMFPNGANDDQVDAAGLGILRLLQNASIVVDMSDVMDDSKKSYWK